MWLDFSLIHLEIRCQTLLMWTGQLAFLKEKEAGIVEGGQAPLCLLIFLPLPVPLLLSSLSFFLVHAFYSLSRPSEERWARLSCFRPITPQPLSTQPSSPQAGPVLSAVHKLSGIYSMWPDARFPLGARFPGDGAGGLGCVTSGWRVEEVKREEGEWGDDNQGQVREGMSFQSKKSVCGGLKRRWD